MEKQLIIADNLIRTRVFPMMTDEIFLLAIISLPLHGI